MTNLEIERRPITDRNEWLFEWKPRDVTASVVAALPRFACHTYVTPLRLFVEKSGIEFLNQDNKVTRRGRWLEPAVAKAVAEVRPEWTLEAPEVYLRSPQHRLGATPDYFIHGDPRGLGVLQCKTVAPHVFERDWLSGTALPRWIGLQVLTEMMLSEAAFGAVAALVVDPFNMDIVIIEVEREPPGGRSQEAEIIDATDAFWADVAAGREPTPDFERDRKAIEALWPQERQGKTIDLSSHNQLGEMLELRTALMKRMKADEAQCDAIENEIRFLAGEAELITGIDGYRITYRTTNFNGYKVDPRSSRVLRIFHKRAEQTT
jgi:predicted phage-related endonuclease